MTGLPICRMQKEMLIHDIVRNAEHSYQKQAIFVLNVGQRVEKEIACPTCNKKLKGDEKFCDKCGAGIYGNNTNKVTKKSLIDQKYIPGCSSMRGRFYCS